MGPFAWRPPFSKALRGKETMTKRLSSSRTFIFLADLVALTAVRMTVAAAAVHPDGYVEIRDRLKDVIISGGENISSVEVEGALLRHPAVQEVAIVGLPHERWGEAPHAFVVLRAGASATEEELLEFARAHLAHFKAPHGVGFRTELPKTATGKIQKYVRRGVGAARRDLHFDVLAAPDVGGRVVGGGGLLARGGQHRELESHGDDQDTVYGVMPDTHRADSSP